MIYVKETNVSNDEVFLPGIYIKRYYNVQNKCQLREHPFVNMWTYVSYFTNAQLIFNIFFPDIIYPYSIHTYNIQHTNVDQTYIE